MPSSMEKMGLDLIKLAGEGASAKAIVKDIKKKYPNAKRKDVMEAAFYMMIDIASTDPDMAVKLQDLALSERAPED